MKKHRGFISSVLLSVLCCCGGSPSDDNGGQENSDDVGVKGAPEGMTIPHKLTGNTIVRIQYSSGATHAERGHGDVIRIERVDRKNSGYRILAIHEYLVFSPEKEKVIFKEFVVGRKWLSNSQVLRLLKLFHEAEFLSLNRKYVNERIRDGGYNSIEIKVNNNAYKVICVNTGGPSGFGTLKQAILKLKPPIDEEAAQMAAQNPNPYDEMSKYFRAKERKTLEKVLKKFNDTASES